MPYPWNICGSFCYLPKIDSSWRWSTELGLFNTLDGVFPFWTGLSF